MATGWKLINVTDERPQRKTGVVTPRAFSGLGTRLEPGEYLFVEAIPGEVEAIVADTEHGALQAVQVDLSTGEEVADEGATVVEEAPAPTATVWETASSEEAPDE